MRDALGEVAVIGERMMSPSTRNRGVADRVEVAANPARATGSDDGRPPLGIIAGADHPARFAHEEITWRGRGFGDPAAVDTDLVAERIGFGPEFGDHFAVDLDPMLANQLFGGPA
jgi:hypothetical protein